MAKPLLGSGFAKLFLKRRYTKYEENANNFYLQMCYDYLKRQSIKHSEFFSNDTKFAIRSYLKSGVKIRAFTKSSYFSLSDKSESKTRI